jgi:hypothetical protein
MCDSLCIDTLNNVDLAKKMQHVFKKGKSTVMALKEIQSQIATQIGQGQS